MPRPNSRLVWTSDPETAKRLRESAPPARDLEPQKQTIRVALDRKRRAGKTMTVASGFELTDESLAALAAKLKKRCGAGGTARGSEIEIQGDHAVTVATELGKLGYRVKQI
ncbi:MAG: translation initiation factor [Thermoanaerobaculia bacterium]